MGFDLGDYKDVAQRIADFRAKHPEGCLRPANPEEPYRIECIGAVYFIVYTAAAYRSPTDPTPGIGVAWEPFPGQTSYTKNSELQNAETSAWGRAIVAVLASESKAIASAEDVRNRRADAEATVVVTMDLVHKVASRTFASEDGDLAADLCDAVVWAATKNRTSVIAECDDKELDAVYSRLKAIESGSVRYEMDSEAVTFITPDGSSRRICWADVPTSSVPATGEGSEPAPSGSDPEPVGAATQLRTQAEEIAAAAPEVTT